MTTDVENNEWKAEAPYLASLPKVNPFRVPEQYFDALSSSLNSSGFIEHLKEKVTAHGFSVPENYFDILREQIISQTSGSILYSRSQEHGYSIPEGYFEKLQASILARTTEESVENTVALVEIPVKLIETDKEVELVKKQTRIVRLWQSDLLKYTSAACFILVTAFGLYLNQQRYGSSSSTSTTEMANEQMLYDIDEQDIIDHVQNVSMEEYAPTATSTELETYILNNYSQNDLSSNL